MLPGWIACHTHLLAWIPSGTVSPGPAFSLATGQDREHTATLNYNATTKLYTLNSSTNLVKIGDTVILYLTGEGVYATAPLLGIAPYRIRDSIWLGLRKIGVRALQLRNGLSIVETTHGNWSGRTDWMQSFKT